MTCIHIQRVKDLISNYRSEPFIDSTDLNLERNRKESILCSDIIGVHIRLCPDCDNNSSIECRKMGCWYRKKILNILNECNCENSQLAVVRNTETSLIRVQSENSSLSREISNLRSANCSLSNTNSNLQTTNVNLQNQLTQKDRDIEWGKNQLALAQRGEREKQSEIDQLTRQLTALQIENNKNKDKIKDLKGELGQSQEEYLNQKIGIKLEKLETLTQQLGINQGQINNLKNAYQQLPRLAKTLIKLI